MPVTPARRARPRTSTRSALVRLTAALAAVAAGTTGCTFSSAEAGSGDTVLTFWHYFQGAQQEWLERQVADFEADHPGVDIQLVETVGSQHVQRLLASTVTGTTPDLFINNIVVDYPTLTSAGVMLDLSPYWDDYADADQFPSSAVWRSGDAVYDLLPYNNLLGLYMNTDVAGRYGITEPPATLPELAQDLAAVTDGGDGGLALSAAPSVEGAWLFAPELLGEGIGYCNFSGPQVVDSFTRLADWARDGYVPQAAATWDQNASWQQFMTGRYAFALNGNWQLGNVGSADFGYVTAQYPAPADGSSTVYPGGEGFAIGATSEHPDLAWEFLQDEVLSRDGLLSLYEAAGSIPLRADLADSPQLADDPDVQPFVRATRSTAEWPDNTSTAEMQTALGEAVSATVSGQLGGRAAARQAVADIGQARSEGDVVGGEACS
ncbi:extracellular solute-binding protein [Pseudokineococcus basanitobsidens]|uniref:Extracellular solute-binding protein n=1 Tax=Pseudokineococcus basanitobsidens TaxID=1926649 RepID=A0ABU8RFV1_9ACTN